MLLTIIFASASVGCAHAQSVAPAPAGAPAKSAPRTESRLRSVVSATPSAQNGPYQTAVEQYRIAAAQDQEAVLVLSQAAAAQNRVVGQIGSSYGLSSRSSSDSVPPVVIQFGTKDASAIGAMEEDLAIMTHIIDRALDRMGENGVDEKLGVPIYYTSGGKSVRALYLEGFGPLIMVKVNFPVHAVDTTETKTTEKPDASEWEEIRNSLRGRGQEVQWANSSSGIPYDPARVDALKKNLVHALKNASNMKGVKPDEYVNVTVFGSPTSTTVESDWPATGGGSGGGRGPGTPNRFGSDSRSSRGLEAARTALQGTVLTIRAKKADIDAAAKGSLDDEAFAKKVAVNTYSGNGYGLTSVNSWIRKSSSSAVAR
ncbi:MAG TPA: hypothetical protein VK615_06335 [Candidatus Binatia bacterium]|nr:hypothetical protein [Candidatus Binatia bacterium]